MDEKSKKIRVAQEIVDTEVRYVRKMGSLFTMFYVRANVLLKLNRPVMSEKEISEYFMNLTDIFELNKNLCRDLVGLRYKGDLGLVDGIASVLLKYTPFLKIYMQYMDKYDNALKVLEGCKKRPKFMEFLQESEMCVGEDLASLHITPVQRIPRYILLMKELLKVSNDIEETLKNSLETSVNELEKTARSINNSVKKAEARDKVVKIQMSLFQNQISLIAPHRYVIAMGKLNTREKGSIFKKTVPHLFVLFSDCLIWATLKSSGKSYKLKHAVPLEKIEAKQKDLPDLKNGQAAFSISSKEIGNKTVDIITNEVSSRNRWLQNIFKRKGEILAENRSRNKVPLTVNELESSILGEKSKGDIKESKKTISRENSTTFTSSTHGLQFEDKEPLGDIVEI